MSTVEARRFAELLPMLEGGELNAALDAEFTELLRALKDHALAFGGGCAKGEMTLKIAIDIDRGDVTVKADVKANKPKAPRRRTRLYVGREAFDLIVADVAERSGLTVFRGAAPAVARTVSPDAKVSP